jgi:hypothetical protein
MLYHNPKVWRLALDFVVADVVRAEVVAGQ